MKNTKEYCEQERKMKELDECTKRKEESGAKIAESQNEVWVLKSMIKLRDDKLKRIKEMSNKYHRRYHCKAGFNQRK